MLFTVADIAPSSWTELADDVPRRELKTRMEDETKAGKTSSRQKFSLATLDRGLGLIGRLLGSFSAGYVRTSSVNLLLEPSRPVHSSQALTKTRSSP